MNNVSRNLLIGATTIAFSALFLNIYFDVKSPELVQLGDPQVKTASPSPVENERLLAETKGPLLSSSTTELTGSEMLPSSPLQKSFASSDPAFAWRKVDLVSLQNEMPDNLYWLLASPTNDALVQEQRKEIKEFWKQQYAKVLSNNATETEIRAYYEHRHQVSTDYIVFATTLLNRHSKDLPERDYHFQILARNIHLAQLEELPRKLQNALDNRDAFESRRSEWLADKSAYETQLHAEREEALRAMGKI